MTNLDNSYCIESNSRFKQYSYNKNKNWRTPKLSPSHSNEIKSVIFHKNIDNNRNKDFSRRIDFKVKDYCLPTNSNYFLKNSSEKVRNAVNPKIQEQITDSFEGENNVKLQNHMQMKYKKIKQPS